MSGRGLGAACVLALLTCWPQLAPAQDGRDPGKAVAPKPAAAETVIARRLNDSVAVRFAADGSERVLYFFDSRAELTDGDEIEQGPSGQTSVVLAEGGQLEMYASGHLVIDGLGTLRDGEIIDELRFPLLTTAEVTAGDRKIVCTLPGGTQAELIDGRITITVVPGRLTIRNEGGNPVLVRGLMTQEPGSSVVSGVGLLTLARGDEVGMPYFRQRARPLGTGDGSWAGLSLREVGPLEVEHDAQRLVVTSRAIEGNRAAFTVGGVRVRIPAGSSMVFERQRRGAPSILQGGGGQITGPAAAEGALPGSEPTPDETLPPGMTAIGLEQYVTARQEGHSDEDLAALGYWVSASVLADFERLAAEPEDPVSGEDSPSADETAGALPEEAATEPASDDGADPAADDASDNPEDNR